MSRHGDAYVKGLRRAYQRGQEAARESALNGYDANPYRNPDHRSCWQDGMMSVRCPPTPDADRD